MVGDPGLNQVVTGLGGLRGAPTSDEIDDLKARGEHLVVAPGGMREAMRPFWADGRVDLGDRRGYLRLALRYELPIIPVVATGLDATFVGLNDGYRTSQRVFHRGDLPAWLAFGAGGIWPLALPFPAKIRQRIGAPIRLATLPARGDEDRLEHAHELVTATLQSMLDDSFGVAEYPWTIPELLRARCDRGTRRARPSVIRRRRLGRLDVGPSTATARRRACAGLRATRDRAEATASCSSSPRSTSRSRRSSASGLPGAVPISVGLPYRPDRHRSASSHSCDARRSASTCVRS